MKNILITRSKLRSKKLALYLNDFGFKVFSQPLFSIEKNLLKSVEINFLQQQVKDIKNIVISSANAVYALNEIRVNKNANIFAVGKATALKIKRLGYKNVFYPSSNGGEELYQLMLKDLSQNIQNQNIYYFRGDKISYDFKFNLEQQGFVVKDFIVYKTREIKNFSKEIRTLINKDYKKNFFCEILIFSQNSLEIFYKICLKNNFIEYFNRSTIICFSNKIAINARKIGFKNALVFHDNAILNNFYDTTK